MTGSPSPVKLKGRSSLREEQLDDGHPFSRGTQRGDHVVTGRHAPRPVLRALRTGALKIGEADDGPVLMRREVVVPADGVGLVEGSEV